MFFYIVKGLISIIRNGVENILKFDGYILRE